MTLDALFANFTHSAFRLETLPQYPVDVEAESFQAFREWRPLPAESVVWFENIVAQVAAGKSWGRVHVIDRPLSDYTRFELAAYADNVQPARTSASPTDPPTLPWPSCAKTSGCSMLRPTIPLRS